MSVGKIAAAVIGGLVVVVGVSLATGSFYNVDQGERAVVLRNGALVRNEEPGFHIKTPWIEDYHTISVRSEIKEFENESVYSRDQQAATMTFSINYSANPDMVDEIYSEYGSLENAFIRKIDRQARTKMKEVFGRYNAVNAIQERAKFGAEVAQAIQAIDTGGVLRIENVQISNIDFSDAYENSVEQRMLAEVQVQKLQQMNEQEKVNAEIAVTKANAAADSTRATAQATADAIRMEGDAQAASIRARGEAEAEIVKSKGEALRDNPLLIELTKAEKWNGVGPTQVVPGSTVPFINVK